MIKLTHVCVKNYDSEKTKENVAVFSYLPNPNAQYVFLSVKIVFNLGFCYDANNLMFTTGEFPQL